MTLTIIGFAGYTGLTHSNEFEEKYINIRRTRTRGITGSGKNSHAKRKVPYPSFILDEVKKIQSDNIFIFDFREIETEGGLFLKPEYAVSIHDSHPNETLSVKAAELFVNRMIDVIENY